VDDRVDDSGRGVLVESFYGQSDMVESVDDTPYGRLSSALYDPSSPALIAVYDALTATPRVEQVAAGSARELIESLATRTYQLSHEAGGQLPYSVIREVVENFIHAGFDEVVVSILDGGCTIRFSDQGPGIRDKERAVEPGFSTATTAMKVVIKGVGSGLPVARECLTFSGGTLEIDDNLGRGTVVTMRMTPVPPATETVPEPQPDGVEQIDLPPLSVRQKQVLSLALELGSVGPTVVSRELGVGLSTAYRDLEHLSQHGLITSDDAGKRVLTDTGIRCLDALFGR
jgi:anti-sigma regulatory factor (Ser/Thr protein kinase)